MSLPQNRLNEVSDIARLLRLDAEAIARHLLPMGKYSMGGREWVCRGRESPTGSPISVFIASGPKQGVVGFWGGAKKGGDILDLIEDVLGGSKKDAINFAKGWLNQEINIRIFRPTVNAVASSDSKNRHWKATNIWDETSPLSGPSAEYLRRRGLDLSLIGNNVRSHKGLKYPGGDPFPAVICRVSNVDDEFLGIWRIFCKPDGSGKAPVDNPKMGLGDVRGGSVRIGGLWPEIGVAEGIETAIACRQLLGPNPIPVWAGLSANGMIAMRIPRTIQKVRIFADADVVKFKQDRIIPSTGLEAADRLADNLRSAGFDVSIQKPPPGMDFLDVLRIIKNGAGIS